MTATTESALTARIRIGKGHQVHAATTDGNALCGSQRRGQRNVSFLPAGTAVTCTKCGVTDEAPAAEAPAATERVVIDGKCHNPAEHRSPVSINRFGNCGVCDYI